MIVIADAIEADVLRIRHEFLEMPGLVLTVAQTAGLYALSMAHATTLLRTLEAEGFLIGEPNGVYRRRTPPAHDDSHKSEDGKEISRDCEHRHGTDHPPMVRR